MLALRQLSRVDVKPFDQPRRVEARHLSDRARLEVARRPAGLEEAEDPADADENSTNETQQSMLTFEKIKDDPMLEEAGRVLRDLIKLNSASERGREIASVGRAP